LRFLTIEGEPRRYLFVAIDRTTRSPKAFLKSIGQAAPFRIQTYLADNGSAFVDHFMNCSQQSSSDHRPTVPVPCKRSNTASSRRVVRKLMAWLSASTEVLQSHCFDFHLGLGIRPAPLYHALQPSHSPANLGIPHPDSGSQTLANRIISASSIKRFISNKQAGFDK
jgi:hypothetical protein